MGWVGSGWVSQPTGRVGSGHTEWTHGQVRAGVWLLAVLMAAPLLVFSITRAVEPVPGLRLYEVCVENPDLDVVKAAYSVGSALVQYLAPIAIVSVAHAQIRNKLRTRMGAAAAQPRPTRAATADQGSRGRPGPPRPASRP